MRKIVLDQERARKAKRTAEIRCGPVAGQLLQERAVLEKNQLPNPGAWNDQHPLYCAAMLALLSAEAECLAALTPGDDKSGLREQQKAEQLAMQAAREDDGQAAEW